MAPRTRVAPTAAPVRRAVRRRRRPIDQVPQSSSPSRASSILRLQSVAGNAAVTRLIQTHPDKNKVKQPPPAKGSTGSGSSRDVPFPGVRPPGYELRPFLGDFQYAEKDRAAMIEALKKRVDDNRKVIAKFLGTYVSATMDIWGRYVTTEMRDTAIASGSGTMTKLLRFVAAESLAILAGGGVGRILKPVWGAAAGKLVEKLTTKSTDFAVGLVGDDAEKLLLAKDMDKRKQALDAINAKLAEGTGEFVEKAVANLGDDSVDRAVWATKAPLADLDLFRIPDKIPPVEKSVIRAVVAGVIASKMHKHDAEKPCDSWGLQCPINEQVPPGSVGVLDDNVIKVGLKPGGHPPQVTYIRFFSASPILVAELAQKAKLGMLPSMALRIEVERGSAAIAAGDIMARVGTSTVSDPDEESTFAKRYDELLKKSDTHPKPDKDITLMTRRPEGGIRVAGAGLAESLWLYEIATGDPSLDVLAAQIASQHLYEQEHVMSDSTEPVSMQPSARRLAELSHTVIEPNLLKGLEKLIADHLGTLTLPNVEPKGKRVAR